MSQTREKGLLSVNGPKKGKSISTRWMLWVSDLSFEYFRLVSRLDSLARNPETVSFHREYNKALEDDNTEFQHLNQQNAGDINLDDQESEEEEKSLSSDDTSDLDVFQRSDGRHKVGTQHP